MYHPDIVFFVAMIL